MRATVFAVLLAFPAYAQEPQCGNRLAFIEGLADEYGEARQNIAITSAGTILETFANLETGTWTILVTQANGQGCVVAYGEAYEAVHDPEGDPA